MNTRFFRGMLAVLAGALIALFVLGCSNGTPIENLQPNETGEQEVVLGVTPFADVAHLTELAGVEKNVDWRVARFFALKALQDFRATNEWEGAVLSERPLIINYQLTGEPRYYEFRVIRDEKEIGAITCVVEEQEGSPVQYVLPFATPVAVENSRSARSNRGSFIDAGYPSKLLFRNVATGRSMEAETGVEDMEEYPVDVKVKDLLKDLDPSLYEEYGITSQDMYDAYIAQQNELEERMNEFWQEVASVKHEILKLTEAEILEAFEPEVSMTRANLDWSSYYPLGTGRIKLDGITQKVGVDQVWYHS